MSHSDADRSDVDPIIAVENLRQDLLDVCALLRRYEEGPVRAQEVERLIIRASRVARGLKEMCGRLKTGRAMAGPDGSLELTKPEEEGLRRARALRDAIIEMLGELQQDPRPTWVHH